MLRRATLCLLLVVVGGCGSDPAASTAKPSSSAASPAQGIGIRPTTIQWTAPPAFQLVASTIPMRIATYRVARADGDPEDGELTVSRVGGDLEKNITRWRDMVKGAKERENSTTTVGDMKVTILWLEDGSYSAMSMSGPVAEPKAHFALLGAVVEDKKGDPHFFKLTGPNKTVEATRAAFDELIQSITPK